MEQSRASYAGAQPHGPGTATPRRNRHDHRGESGTECSGIDQNERTRIREQLDGLALRERGELAGADCATDRTAWERVRNLLGLYPRLSEQSLTPSSAVEVDAESGCGARWKGVLP